MLFPCVADRWRDHPCWLQVRDLSCKIGSGVMPLRSSQVQHHGTTSVRLTISFSRPRLRAATRREDERRTEEWEMA